MLNFLDKKNELYNKDLIILKLLCVIIKTVDSRVIIKIKVQKVGICC